MTTDTHPLVEQSRESVEQPDQQGVLIAPDGLQLRVSLVLDVKPAQSVHHLQNTHSQAGFLPRLLLLRRHVSPAVGPAP